MGRGGARADDVTKVDQHRPGAGAAAPDPLGIEDVDHLIVGAGQAASVLAAGLPEGETVALVERRYVGGSCVNVGCTPTKTLIASARVAHLARRAADYGVVTGGVRVDYGRVHARMDDLRTSMRDDLEGWLRGMDRLTLVEGHARFVGERTVAVGERRIRGRRVYLDVGSRARRPDVEGIDDVATRVLDNASILDLRVLPERLLVVGGSYVGLELAQAFARFGSRVTVVERGGRVARKEDRDVSSAVQEALERDGISFALRTSLTHLRPSPTGLEATLEGQGGERRTLEATHVLLAAGRVPNTDDLAPEASGVELDDRGYVRVDERLRTTCDGVFALGDVNGRGAFTHTSVHDGEIALDVVRGGTRTVDERTTVYAMFVDPPLGRVGLTEAEARERGHRVLRAVRPMSRVNRAREMGETHGFMKLLVDADDDRILGAAVLGPSGDEVINLLSALVHAGVRARELRRAVLVHPTVGELLPFLVDGLEPAN